MHNRNIEVIGRRDMQGNFNKDYELEHFGKNISILLLWLFL